MRRVRCATLRPQDPSESGSSRPLPRRMRDVPPSGPCRFARSSRRPPLLSFPFPASVVCCRSLFPDGPHR
eukprot:6662076-Pyramimonas_sp.AAC.1